MFCFEGSKTAVVSSEESIGGIEEEAKIELKFLQKLQKRAGGRGPKNILTFLRGKNFFVLIRMNILG